MGAIGFDGTSVPLKAVSYPAGGTLKPPASAAVAGLSTRHQPLFATEGTTVITWHVRYGRGCDGALNPLSRTAIGSTFTMRDSDGRSQEFRLVERHRVDRGDYRPEWFRLNGAPQTVLFTCTDLAGGAYRKTMVLIAEPVSA